MNAQLEITRFSVSSDRGSVKVRIGVLVPGDAPLDDRLGEITLSIGPTEAHTFADALDLTAEKVERQMPVLTTRRNQIARWWARCTDEQRRAVRTLALAAGCFAPVPFLPAPWWVIPLLVWWTYCAWVPFTERRARRRADLRRSAR